MILRDMRCISAKLEPAARVTALLSLVPESDPAPREVVRRDLKGYAVASEHTDAKPAHLARDGGVDVMSVVHLHTKGRVGQNFGEDRKSTRLNSSHLVISYAVFC